MLRLRPAASEGAGVFQAGTIARQEAEEEGSYEMEAVCIRLPGWLFILTCNEVREELASGV